MATSETKKLVAFLESKIYAKAHFAVEAYKKQNSTRILNEADPHPRVEKDRLGNPVIPSKEDYGEYFQTMAANYVQDQIRRNRERWQQLSDDSSNRAERQALSNELAAANDALKANPQPNVLPPVLNVLFQDKE